MQDVKMSVEGFNGVFLRGAPHQLVVLEMNIIIRHLTTYHSIPLNTMHHHINTIMAATSKNFEMRIVQGMYIEYAGYSGRGVVLQVYYSNVNRGSRWSLCIHCERCALESVLESFQRS